MSGQKRKLYEELKNLTTEQRNLRTVGIDLASTEEILGLMNTEDRTVADVVREVLPDIARAADLAVASFKHGGRLLYFGAGTSGRLGILDSAECPPTSSSEGSGQFHRLLGLERQVQVGDPGRRGNARAGVDDLHAARVVERSQSDQPTRVLC